MNDALEKLRHELKAAQRALADAEARCARQEGERQAIAKEAENTRKQIEQAHQEWMSALDAVEEPIFVHDKDFRVLRCNLAYQQCAGIPFRQIIGQPYYELFPKTHAPLPNCRRTLENESEMVADEEVLVDGRIYRSRANVIRDAQGGYLCSMHILEDITERKQAEAALKKSYDLLQPVVETAPVRIFWKDRNMRFLGCNILFALDAGFARPEELIGKSDFDMVWKDQAERYRNDDMAVMESGSPKLGIEEPQTTPSGDTIWLRTSKVPLRDEGNRVIGVLGIYDDITERKQADANLSEQLEELRRWHDATLGREERILELKHEVNELLGQAGQPPRYHSATSPEPKEE